MLIDRRNLAPHLPWIVFVVACAGAATIWYVMCAWNQTRWPGGSSLPGLVFGTIGGGIVLFGFLLWPRKKVRAWRIGRAQTWMRAHIWLCLLSVPLLVMHSGFQSGGQLSSVLSTLFGIVIVSGVVGLVFQQFLPRQMLERVPAETIYSQIDEVAEQLYLRTKRLVRQACGPLSETDAAPDSDVSASPAVAPYVTLGAVRSVGNVRGKVLQTQLAALAVPEAEPLREFFDTRVAQFLRGGRKTDSALREPAKAAELFQELRDRLNPAAQPVVDALESACDQRRQFDVQARLHVWMHAWLCIHLPLSIALVGLMFVHIFVALKYW